MTDDPSRSFWIQPGVSLHNYNPSPGKIEAWESCAHVQHRLHREILPRGKEIISYNNKLSRSSPQVLSAGTLLRSLPVFGMWWLFTASYTLWPPIGLHNECGYTTESMSGRHQIPSAEPTLDPQCGPCRVQTTAASSPTEEDKDGFSEQSQIPWQLSLLSTKTMFIFPTVLLLNI